MLEFMIAFGHVIAWGLIGIIWIVSGLVFIVGAITFLGGRK